MKNKVHKAILGKVNDVENWFTEKSEGLSFPITTSVDIRDAGFKFATVDSNIYPAGFNNMCEVDRDSAPDAIEPYIKKYYSKQIKNVLLLTEEHTNNLYYWDNIFTLSNIFERAGIKVFIGIPKDIDRSFVQDSASGHKLNVNPIVRNENCIRTKDGPKPDLIISNNDFSNPYTDIFEGVDCPINPPKSMGWHVRKKSEHFKFYNSLATEFGNLIDIDPWTFEIKSELYQGFDPGSEDSREGLALKVGEVLENISSNYSQRGINEKPSVFIKNNSGTYGLGIIEARSEEDVRKWNYKAKKKMKAAKGGGKFGEVIIQEGIPSCLVVDSEVSEPAIYMLGNRLVGGFLRSHSKKGPTENLNSPGAVFKKLCMSDLQVDIDGSPLENVYGWVAKLSALANAMEMKSRNISIN